MNQALVQILQLLEPVALKALSDLLQQLNDHVSHAAVTHPNVQNQPTVPAEGADNK
jgi:hypothetical protein